MKLSDSLAFKQQFVADSSSIPVFAAGEVGRTLGSDNSWLPTVSIDVAGFPAISDLARVHAVEGIGDVSTHAIRQNESVIIGVRVSVPVEATFAIVFNYFEHKQFLQDVATAGTLTFATTDTRSAHIDMPLWLSVDIDGDSLRQSVLIETD